jgi:hypothetical protein
MVCRVFCVSDTAQVELRMNECKPLPAWSASCSRHSHWCLYASELNAIHQGRIDPSRLLINLSRFVLDRENIPPKVLTKSSIFSDQLKLWCP